MIKKNPGVIKQKTKNIIFLLYIIIYNTKKNKKKNQGCAIWFTQSSNSYGKETVKSIVI